MWRIATEEPRHSYDWLLWKHDRREGQDENSSGTRETFAGPRRVTKYKINPLHPTSDLQILLSLSPDDFTRQRETPLGLKGLKKKLSSLTLYTLRVTYRFYSVLSQTILLVKGRPFGLKG